MEINYEAKYLETIDNRLKKIEEKQDEILQFKTKVLGFSFGVSSTVSVLVMVVQNYLKLYK